MNITRDVMSDMLPVYFSGEASEDTKRLMEEYFRANPDFERIARKAVTPLEELRSAAPVLPAAEREKQDLEWVREELFRRQVAFGLALLFTLAPLMSIYRSGHLVWKAVLNEVAFFCWGIAPLFWLQSFTRLTRRTTAMVSSIYFALLGFVFAFHLFLPGWQSGLRGRLGLATCLWACAIGPWANYLRLSRSKRTAGGK
jgi:hypothetical protein